MPSPSGRIGIEKAAEFLFARCEHAAVIVRSRYFAAGSRPVSDTMIRVLSPFVGCSPATIPRSSSPPKLANATRANGGVAARSEPLWPNAVTLPAIAIAAITAHPTVNFLVIGQPSVDCGASLYPARGYAA